MKDTDEEYKEVWKAVIGALIILSIMVLFFTSCKSVKHLKKSTNDSTSVSKVVETKSKLDSSGSKSENTKETVYYPQPIYIQGKDGEVKVVSVPQYIKETGKTEEAKVVKDESWREAFDSLKVSILALSKDNKTSVLNIWQIIAIGALIFLAIKLFIKK